jgi:hypothetical protein
MLPGSGKVIEDLFAGVLVLHPAISPANIPWKVPVVRINSIQGMPFRAVPQQGGQSPDKSSTIVPRLPDFDSFSAIFGIIRIFGGYSSGMGRSLNTAASSRKSAWIS